MEELPPQRRRPMLNLDHLQEYWNFRRDPLTTTLPRTNSDLNSNDLNPEFANEPMESEANVPSLRLLENILDVFISNFTFLLLLPLLLPLGVVNVLIRFVVSIYLRLRFRGTVRLMRGRDAFWAQQDGVNQGNFTSLHILQGECDLNSLRQKLLDQWIEKKDLKGNYIYGRMKLRVARKFGYYCWERPKSFSIADHVKLFNEHDTAEKTEKEVFKLMQEKVSNPLLEGEKPQWEILIVPKYKYSDSRGNSNTHYALIYHFHHSIMDSISAVQVMRNVFADGPVRPLIVNPMAPVRMPFLKKWISYFLAVILSAPMFFRIIHRKEDNCFYSGASLMGSKFLSWSRPLNMKVLRKIKEHHRTTSTAVIIASVSAALRKLATIKGKPIPKDLYALTTAALLPYPNIKPQNRLSALFSSMPVHLSEPLERLKNAAQMVNRFTVNAEIIMGYTYTRLIGRLPGFLIDRMVRMYCTASIVLTNVPTAEEHITFFGGHKLVDVVAWSPIKNKMGKKLLFLDFVFTLNQVCSGKAG